MARFVSRFKNYRHGVRNAQERMVGRDSQGQEVNEILSREIYAVFNDGDELTEDEVQIGLKSLVHYGLPYDRDTEELFSARSRLSALDTVAAQAREGWTDKERELVEQKLRTSQHYGSDHLEIVPEPAKVPWPTYDSTPPDDIVVIAAATGSVDQALAYERENQNRPELVRALEEEPVEEKAVVLDAS